MTTDTMRLSPEEWQTALGALREFVRLASEEAGTLLTIGETEKAAAMKDHAQRVRRLLRSMNRSNSRRAPAEDETEAPTPAVPASGLTPGGSCREAPTPRQQKEDIMARKAPSGTVLADLEFTRNKDTKNTVRFAEQHDPDVAPVVGMLYVQRVALGESVDTVEKINVLISLP